ncbi:serine/threonine-protein kinase [Pendulispora rubella]|uniref:Serine/threonine-protein kinase n=1 Tax=Pendulispora rubella TaxID=2741070 RepID=A0ABZ2KUE4_9BACT
MRAKDDELFAARFRIEEEAGVGGMGIVYRALDQSSGEIVALKVVRKTGPGSLRRFDAETDALEKLRHPAIVRHIAHGVGDEGQPYLAMEWVDGETLASKLRRERLDVCEVITVARRIADALAAAHAIGILHRDIKPSNVLLPGGDLVQAKLADFGLARSMESSQTNATMTGVIVGTPGYMAPEQAHGVRDLDGRADLFSLGCMLFRCLTDTEAFEGSRALTALAKLVLLEPSRVSSLRPDVPPALDDLVGSLLSKEREHRPLSAVVVRDTLDRIAEDVSADASLRRLSVRERLPPESTRFVSGTSFGRYVLGRRIGMGGMGELYLAHDTTLDRKVALKVLRRSPDGQATEHLLREARAAATLSHPNVVTIYDVGEHEGVPFLAMEYIAGRSLRDYVGEATPDLDRRIGWMGEVARGLAAAHQAGLVHGDVKPENVMVADDGAVKILDFGLATAVPDCIMGTAAYMAPEQIRGEPLDGRVDQFAWGVTAYELVTGRLPWPGHDTLEMLASVLADDPSDAVRASLPSEISGAILKTLRKQRDERFPTMDSLIPVLAPSTASTQRSSAVKEPPLPSPSKRRKHIVWLASAIFTALIALTTAIVAFRAVRRHDSPAGTAASSTASPPVLVTALPVSPSCVPAAAALYKEGLRALRESAYRRALGYFEQAAAVDPMCPEPQLRVTMLAYSYWPRSRAREQLRRAMGFRDTMSERDRVVLDAWALLIAPDSPREAETIQAFDDAIRRFPNDAELYVLDVDRRRSTVMRADQLEALLGMVRKATQLDPGYADAYSMESQILIWLGRGAESLAALDRCLDVAPGAVDCMEIRSGTLRRLGRCEEAVASARSWISWEPDEPAAYQELAPSLAARGASREAIEEALLLRWKHLPPADREPTRLCDMAKLSVWMGDFDGALKFADGLERHSTGSATLDPHLCATVTSVDALLETGRDTEATNMAERFLHRNEAWVRGESNLATEYPKPFLLALAFGQNRRTMIRWQEATETWERVNRTRMDAYERWIFRWGPMAGVRNHAAEALLLDPRLAADYSEVPRARNYNIGAMEAYEGHLRLAAGDVVRAAPLLETATRSCQGLHHGAMNVRAHLWLGIAREQLGDVPAACDAYRFVTERWGSAKPTSVSAREAERRSRALNCPRSVDR